MRATVSPGARLAFTLLAIITFVLALAIALATASPAQADRIRAGSCDVYNTEVLDPVAPESGHLHSFVMGRVLSNTDTGFDYKTRGFTSCSSENSQWATSGGWFPRAQNFIADGIAIYYRDPGERHVNPIPTDLRMLSHDVTFSQSGDPHQIRIDFPNCVAVDESGEPLLDSFDHKSHLYDAGAAACPSSHPYRIPKTNFLVHWPQNFRPSTLVSIGNGEWGPAGLFMHGDYHAGVQDEFNVATDQNGDGDEADRIDKALIDLCLNDVPPSVEAAHPRCGPVPASVG